MNFDERYIQQKVVELTRELIKVPSMSGQEKEMQTIISDKLTSLGLKVELDDVGNVIAELNGERNTPTLLLSGHMDTVAADTGWSYDPFSAEMVDGKIYGRGAADMKGGLASIITAVEALQNNDIKLKGKLYVLATVREEVPIDNGMAYFLNYMRRRNIRINSSIIGEPTSLNIGLGNKGRMEIKIITRGKAAHASIPEKGINAIYSMAKIINSIEKMKLKKIHIKGIGKVKGAINVGIIKGGVRPNTVPDLCEIIIDRRLIPTETPEKVLSEFQKIINKLKEKNEKIMAEINLSYPPAMPVIISKNETIVEVLKNAFKYIGEKEKYIFLSGTTEACLLNGVASIPTVLFGPGNIAQAHAIDEYVEIKSLVKATKIYFLTILKYLGEFNNKN